MYDLKISMYYCLADCEYQLKVITNLKGGLTFSITSPHDGRTIEINNLIDVRNICRWFKELWENNVCPHCKRTR